MKRLLVDANIVLDVLQERQPHFEMSREVWIAVETGKVEGLLAAHAVTTIHYLLRRQHGDADGRTLLSGLLSVFQIAPVTAAVIREALALSGSDFEDCVCAIAAKHSACDCIVTRDPKGFRLSPVVPMTPAAIVPLFTS